MLFQVDFTYQRISQGKQSGHSPQDLAVALNSVDGVCNNGLGIWSAQIEQSSDIVEHNPAAIIGKAGKQTIGQITCSMANGLGKNARNLLRVIKAVGLQGLKKFLLVGRKVEGFY